MHWPPPWEIQSTTKTHICFSVQRVSHNPMTPRNENKTILLYIFTCNSIYSLTPHSKTEHKRQWKEPPDTKLIVKQLEAQKNPTTTTTLPQSTELTRYCSGSFQDPFPDNPPLTLPCIKSLMSALLKRSNSRPATSNSTRNLYHVNHRNLSHGSKNKGRSGRKSIPRDWRKNEKRPGYTKGRTERSILPSRSAGLASQARNMSRNWAQD